MTHLENNAGVVKQLARQEESERHVSTVLKKTSKIVLGLTVVLAGSAAKDKSIKLAAGSVLLGVSAIGFALAGEIFDMSADRAGLTSDLLS
jgi:hypothetical protein